MPEAEYDQDAVLPALYEHCVRTYNAMLAESRVVVDADVNIVVYEGFLTQLITGELNLSVPYYTSVRKSLIRMGCVKQLRRGGGTSPSQWELIREPNPEAFMRSEPPKTRAVSKVDERNEALNEQIRNLSQRVADLEEFQAAVIDMLQEKFGVEEVHSGDDV